MLLHYHRKPVPGKAMIRCYAFAAIHTASNPEFVGVLNRMEEAMEISKVLEAQSLAKRIHAKKA